MAEGPVRWGILGTARINERLIPAIRASERSELLGVASRSQERALAYASEWDIQRAYGAYEEMLSDPEVDVVYISLPNSFHTEWAIACADAGKHVLCEKPLALTPEDVDLMAEASERNGVVVQEATMMRFHAQTRKIQELVSQAAIGELRAMRGTLTFSLTREGDIRLDPRLGGGSLWDVGSYPVCFMRTVLQENPVEVQGLQVSSPSGVDLTFLGQMRFPSGTVGQFFSSFQAVLRTEAELIGSRGTIHLNEPWTNKIGVTATVTIDRKDGSRGRDGASVSYENVNSYRDEVDSMAATILDGADPVISLADSRDNVATIAGLYRSAREGRPVPL